MDVNDNELALLEAVHLFVEVLDHFFGSVCELDLVFNFHKAYTDHRRVHPRGGDPGAFSHWSPHDPVGVVNAVP